MSTCTQSDPIVVVGVQLNDRSICCSLAVHRQGGGGLSVAMPAGVELDRADLKLTHEAAHILNGAEGDALRRGRG